mmetsp:Transcript_14738/g.26424  ORF Transcript_14738/g.26424 Transcript_14738/m.26424 type:complete len:232 (+) Transcript_14738:384-1079(+)
MRASFTCLVWGRPFGEIHQREGPFLMAGRVMVVTILWRYCKQTASMNWSKISMVDTVMIFGTLQIRSSDPVMEKRLLVQPPIQTQTAITLEISSSRELLLKTFNIKLKDLRPCHLKFLDWAEGQPQRALQLHRRLPPLHRRMPPLHQQSRQWCQQSRQWRQQMHRWHRYLPHWRRQIHQCLLPRQRRLFLPQRMTFLTQLPLQPRPLMLLHKILSLAQMHQSEQEAKPMVV